MGNSFDGKRKKLSELIKGVKIPILTLDTKWYRLLNKLHREIVKSEEDRLNDLLRKQGKANSEIKEVKKLKMKLMNEIVPMVDEASQTPSKQLEKDIEAHKKLIEQCNEKLDAMQDSLLDLPAQIDEANKELMLQTVEYCYEEIQENQKDIEEIEAWVTQIRIELKKKLIEKQEKEEKNHIIYSYMNDIFGADAMDLFDLTYDPEIKHPKQHKD